MRVAIQLDDGSFINRCITPVRCGNFVMNVVRYNNEEYLIGDGDEYLHGYNKVFKLGKKLTRGGETVKNKDAGNYAIFEDRVQSLLRSWKNYKQNHQDDANIDSVCIEGFLKELNDDYTKSLTE